MERTAIKIKRQAVISNPEDQQKFSQLRKLQKKILRKLDITKYYQEQLGIAITPKDKGYFSALCPLHSDTKPSLSINIKKGTWKCWGACSDGGSIFKFHQKKNNFNTIEEAVRSLARQAGITIQK